MVVRLLLIGLEGSSINLNMSSPGDEGIGWSAFGSQFPYNPVLTYAGKARAGCFRGWRRSIGFAGTGPRRGVPARP